MIKTFNNYANLKFACWHSLKLVTGCSHGNLTNQVLYLYNQKYNCKIFAMCILTKKLNQVASAWMFLILIQNHLHVKDTAWNWNLY